MCICASVSGEKGGGVLDIVLVESRHPDKQCRNSATTALLAIRPLGASATAAQLHAMARSSVALRVPALPHDGQHPHPQERGAHSSQYAAGVDVCGVVPVVHHATDCDEGRHSRASANDDEVGECPEVVLPATSAVLAGCVTSPEVKAPREVQRPEHASRKGCGRVPGWVAQLALVDDPGIAGGQARKEVGARAPHGHFYTGCGCIRDEIHNGKLDCDCHCCPCGVPAGRMEQRRLQDLCRHDPKESQRNKHPRPPGGHGLVLHGIRDGGVPRVDAIRLGEIPLPWR
mmetsp:Transcript_45274/g.117277  ORF Transcript_45274/g.117277 Transcript_45274/m.117277 type:complete len:287 (-) Transcript_45274:433-1293(-)